MNWGLAIGLAIVIVLIFAHQPCCPGEQRPCDGGVRYCRKTGYGWEECQKFITPKGVE